jgi:hypothetical protein
MLSNGAMAYRAHDTPAQPTGVIQPDRLLSKHTLPHPKPSSHPADTLYKRPRCRRSSISTGDVFLNHVRRVSSIGVDGY